MRLQFALSNALLVSLLFGTHAFAEEVVSSGAPQSAPACKEKADVIALVAAISKRDGQKIIELTSGGRCWGVWDGSTGNVVETDPATGLSRVAFSKLARLPSGRHETLWVEQRFLSPVDR